MTFRAHLDALRLRRDALRRDIANATSPRREALDAELAHVTARLDEERHALARFVVDRARGAFACPARWEGMVGDGAVRDCGLCDRKVYDFAGLTALEATRLLIENEGTLCARLFRRADGRVLTADCAPGRRRHRRRLAVLGAAAAAITSAAVGALGPAPPPPRSPTVSSLERAMQERARRPWAAPEERWPIEGELGVAPRGTVVVGLLEPADDLFMSALPNDDVGDD